jgi:hypothetical protein
MRKFPLLVVVTVLALGLAVGMLLGTPALAGISGGSVAKTRRCERFSSLSEGDISTWLSTYAPGGPSQAMLSAGGDGGGKWMVCAHGPDAVGGDN